MLSVSIHEAKTQLSALISRVEVTGEHVIVCRHGRAVAEIVPRTRGMRTKLDPQLKNVRLLEDPTTSTEEEWEGAKE